MYAYISKHLRKTDLHAFSEQVAYFSDVQKWLRWQEKVSVAVCFLFLFFAYGENDVFEVPTQEVNFRFNITMWAVIVSRLNPSASELQVAFSVVLS